MASLLHEVVSLWGLTPDLHRGFVPLHTTLKFCCPGNNFWLRHFNGHKVNMTFGGWVKIEEKP